MASAITSTGTVTAAAATGLPTDGNRATPQGGIFDHSNPSQYDEKNPITLFIIQAALIIIFCRVLHYPLSKIRQPRVISEVIGGILLGPSVMGRIPGFKDAIFPDDAIPNLNLVANLGLVLFLFMIGVETNLRTLVSNWRVAISVSAAGMILPFALGCAVAYGLYHEFDDDPELAPISFGIFMLFIGIAMAITAFPVLCRILTELDLLKTQVGVIVLSAGVGNDVVGWVLLALCVALVNASSGLTALWVLLTCVGFVLFLTYAVRPCFLWFLKRTGSLHDGPDQSVVALTLLLALAAAFFTQVIGVHAIFGGFLIGLICPHEGGFAIKITEKIEDLIGALFLPLYFALSGLNTNIGLLDTGITWGYVFAVTLIAFIAKVVGGMLASKFTGMLWRESATIGVLMSCKGLVELIVLNIGLQAKILTTRTFTIFVVMALITTFLTTPITLAFYPEWYRVKVDRWRRGEIDWDGNPLDSENEQGGSDITQQKARGLPIQKLFLYLRLDNLPGIFAFVSLLGSHNDSTSEPLRKHHIHEDQKAKDSALAVKKDRPVQVHGIRLVELTDRDSSVMKVSGTHDFTFSDPILNIFRTFGQFHNVAVSGGVVIAPETSYAETIVSRARDFSSDLVLLPWSETGSMSERQIPFLDDKSGKFVTGPHSSFISSVLKDSRNNVGLFVNKGFGGPSLNRLGPGQLSRSISGNHVYTTNDLAMSPSLEQGHHIVVPYIGGPDDQMALRLVMQLAKHPIITATVAYVSMDAEKRLATASSSAIPPTRSTLGGTSYTSAMSAQEKAEDVTFFNTIRDSVPSELAPRVVFQSINTTPDEVISVAVQTVKLEVGRSKANSGDLVVLGRNSVFSVSNSFPSGEIGSEARRALGVLGEAMVDASHGVQASVLVIQAGQDSSA